VNTLKIAVAGWLVTAALLLAVGTSIWASLGLSGLCFAVSYIASRLIP
jgi:hypothetical protein